MAALSTIPKNNRGECDLTEFLKILLPDGRAYEQFVDDHFVVDPIQTFKMQQKMEREQKEARIKEKLESDTNNLITTLKKINGCFEFAELTIFPKDDLTKALTGNHGIEKEVERSLLFLGLLYSSRKLGMNHDVQSELDKYKQKIDLIDISAAPSRDFLLQKTDDAVRKDKEAGKTMVGRWKEIFGVDEKKRNGKEKGAKATIKPSKAPDRKQAVRNAKTVIKRTVETVTTQQDQAQKKSARKKVVQTCWEEVWEPTSRDHDSDDKNGVIKASPQDVVAEKGKITRRVPVEEVEWKLITFERENQNLAYFTMSATSAQIVKKLFWGFKDFTVEQRGELSNYQYDYLSKALELSYDFDCRRQMREPARPKHRGLDGTLLKVGEEFYKMAAETVCAIDGLPIGDNPHRCNLCHVAFSDRMHWLLNPSESDRNSTFCLVRDTAQTTDQTISKFLEENKVYNELLRQRASDDSDAVCVEVDDEVEIDSQCCFWKVNFVETSSKFTYFKVFPYDESDQNVIDNPTDNTERKQLNHVRTQLQKDYPNGTLPPVVRVPKAPNLNRAYKVKIGEKQYALYTFRHSLGYDFSNLFSQNKIFWDEWHSTYDKVRIWDLEEEMAWNPQGLNVGSQFSNTENGNIKKMDFFYNRKTAFSFQINATGAGLDFQRLNDDTGDNMTVFAGDPEVKLDFDLGVLSEDRAGLLWMVPPAQYLQGFKDKLKKLEDVPDNDKCSTETFKVTFTMKELQGYVHDKLGGSWPTLNCYFVLKGLPYMPISRMKRETVQHVDNQYFWFWQNGGVYRTVAEEIQIAAENRGGTDNLINDDVYVFRNHALSESDPDYEFLASFQDATLEHGKSFTVCYKAASRALSVQQNVRAFLSQHKQSVICFCIEKNMRIPEQTLKTLKEALLAEELTGFTEIVGDPNTRLFTVTPPNLSQIETKKDDIARVISISQKLRRYQENFKFRDAPPTFTESELDFVEETLKNQSITTIGDVKAMQLDTLQITDDALKNKTVACLREAVQASKESWSAGTVSGNLSMKFFSCTPAQCRNFTDSASNWKFAEGFRKWDQCPSRTSFDTLAGFKVPSNVDTTAWENMEGVTLAKTLCAHCEDLFVRQQYSQAPEVHPRTRFELLQSFFYQYELPNKVRLDHHEYLTASERGASVDDRVPNYATELEKASGKLNSLFFKFCPAVHQWRYAQSKVSADEEITNSFYCRNCFARGRILFHDEDGCKYSKSKQLADGVDMRPFWVTVGWKDNDLVRLFDFPSRELKVWCQNWESYEAHRADYLRASVLAKIQPAARRKAHNTFERSLKAEALQGLKFCISKHPKDFAPDQDARNIMERFKLLKRYGLGTLEELMDKKSKLQIPDMGEVKHHLGLQALVGGTESLWEFFRTSVWDRDEFSEEEARAALMRKVAPSYREDAGSDNGDDSDANFSDQESEEFDDDDMIANEVAQTQLDELNDNGNNFDQVNVFDEVMNASPPDLHSNFTLTVEEIKQTLAETLHQNLQEGCELTLDKAMLWPPGKISTNLLTAAQSATPTSQDIVGGMGSQIQIDRNKLLGCFFKPPLCGELQNILSKMEKDIQVSTGQESVQTKQNEPAYTVLDQQKLTYHLFLIATILKDKRIVLKVREWQVLQSVEGQVQPIAANQIQLREVFARREGMFPVRIKKSDTTNGTQSGHLVHGDGDEPNARVIPPMFPCRLEERLKGGTEDYEMPSDKSSFFRKFTMNDDGELLKVLNHADLWVEISDGQTADGGGQNEDLNIEQILKWDGMLEHRMHTTDEFDIHDYFLVTQEGVRTIHQQLAVETREKIEDIETLLQENTMNQKQMELYKKELKEHRVELEGHDFVSANENAVPNVVLQIEGMKDDTISFRRHEYTTSPSSPDVLNALKGQYVLTLTQIFEDLHELFFKFNPVEVFAYQRVQAKRTHTNTGKDSEQEVLEFTEGTVYKKSDRRVFVLWDDLDNLFEYDALHPECFDLIDFRPSESEYVAMDYIEEGSNFKLVPDFKAARQCFLKDMLGTPRLMINPFYYTFTTKAKTFTCSVAPTEIAEIPHDVYAFIAEAVFEFDRRQALMLINQGTRRNSSIAKQNDDDDLFGSFVAFCTKNCQTEGLGNLFKVIAEKYAPNPSRPLTFDQVFGSENESLRFFYKNISMKIQNTKEEFLGLFGDPLAPDTQTIEGCFIWKEIKKDDQAWEKDSKTRQIRIEAECCMVPGMREHDVQNDNDGDGDARLHREQTRRNKVKMRDLDAMEIRQTLQACMWELEKAVFEAKASQGVNLKKFEVSVYEKIKDICGGDSVHSIFWQMPPSSRARASVSEFFSYVMKWMFRARSKTAELMMENRAGNQYVMEELLYEEPGVKKRIDGENGKTKRVDRDSDMQAMRSVRSVANFIQLYNKMIMFADKTFQDSAKALKEKLKGLGFSEWKEIDSDSEESLQIQHYYHHLRKFHQNEKDAFIYQCSLENIQDAKKLCALLGSFVRHMDSVKYTDGGADAENSDFAFLLDLTYEGDFSALFEVECLKILLEFVDYWTFKDDCEPKKDPDFFDFMVILFEHVIDKTNCEANSSFIGSQFRADVSDRVQLHVILLLQKLIRFFTVKLCKKQILKPEITGSKRIHHLFIDDDGDSGSETDAEDEEDSEDDFDDGENPGDEPVSTARGLLRKYFFNEGTESVKTLNPSHAHVTGINGAKVPLRLLPAASSQDKDVPDGNISSDSDDSSQSVANAFEQSPAQVFSSDESSAEDKAQPEAPVNHLAYISDDSDAQSEALGLYSDADDEDGDSALSGIHDADGDSALPGIHDANDKDRDSGLDDMYEDTDYESGGESDNDSHASNDSHRLDKESDDGGEDMDDGGQDSDAEDASQAQILEMIRLAQKHLGNQFKGECDGVEENATFSQNEIDNFRKDVGNLKTPANEKHDEEMDLLLKWCEDMSKKNTTSALVILYNTKQKEYKKKLDDAYERAAAEMLGKETSIRIDTDKLNKNMNDKFWIDMLIIICSHLTKDRTTYYFGQGDPIRVPRTLTDCLRKLMPPTRAGGATEPLMSINWTVRNAHLFRVDKNSGDDSDAFSRQHQYTKSYDTVDINPSIFDLMAVAGQDIEKHESAYLGISYAAWHATRFFGTDEMDRDLRAFFIQPLERGQHKSGLLRAFSYFMHYIQTHRHILNHDLGDARVDDSVPNDTTNGSQDDSENFDDLNGLCCTEEYLTDMKDAIAKVCGCVASDVSGEFVRNKRMQKDDVTGGWQLKLFQIFSGFFATREDGDNFQEIVTTLSLLTGIDLLLINDKQDFFDSTYGFDDDDADATDDDGDASQAAKDGDKATEEDDEESEDESEEEGEEDLLNKTVVAFVDGEVYLFVKANLDDKEKGDESGDESEEDG